MNGNYNLSHGFLFLYDWLPLFHLLSAEEFKALLMALIARQKDGVPIPPLEGELTQVFASMIEPTIKRRLEGQKAGLKGKKKATKKAPTGVPLPPSEAKQSRA